MKLNKRNGISLIVLVITIIIMIILAGAIILSLSGTGLISNATKGAFQSDISTMQEELGVYIANKITETKGKYTQDTLFASKDNLEENGTKVEGKNIKNVLTSIDKKYLDEVEIINGKVVYVGDNLNKIKWANEILLGVKKELKESTSETSSITLEESANLNLVSYRIYGNSVEKVLPSEYQQVEYIEATGTQYINTGIVPQSITELELVFSCTNVEEGFSAGWGSGGSQEAFSCGVNSKNGFFSYVSDNWKIKKIGMVANTEKHVFNLKSGEQKFDGIVYGNDTIGNTAGTEQYMYLFKRHVEWEDTGTETSEGYNGYGRVYSCKIYSNDTMVRNFIPCYRIEDNVIGLYDLVNDKFYTNKGDGSFVKGENISSQSVGDKLLDGEYKVPITLIGKNIFDINADYSKWANDEGGLTFTNEDFHTMYWEIDAMKGKFKENTQYVWSFDYEITNSDNNGIIQEICYSDGTKKYGDRLVTPESGSTQKSGRTIVISELGKTIDYIDIGYNTSTRACNVKITNMMIEEGNKETSYEPYNAKEYNIYLDEPLRKIENYVDYIDFRKQEVVRNVEEVDGELIGLSTPKVEKISLPSMLLTEGINNINILTNVSPSKIETIYYTK